MRFRQPAALGYGFLFASCGGYRRKHMPLQRSLRRKRILYTFGRSERRDSRSYGYPRHWFCRESMHRLKFV